MPGSPGARAVRPGLADAMRDRTRALHELAEQSGIVREVLWGRVSRDGYVLYIRNLLPAYEQLETSIEKLRHLPALAGIARSEIYRSPALRSDLEALGGADWRTSIPVLSAASGYADRIARAAQGDGARLLAHAYTRYLGDLNGGLVLGRILARTLALEPGARAFYAFPLIGDLNLFIKEYREALDSAGREIDDFEAVVGEAESAFRDNIEVSREVLGAAESGCREPCNA
jgi:heme oxygenase